jgi:hypothetical protein
MTDRLTPKRPHGVRAFLLMLAAAGVMGGVAGAGSVLLRGQDGAAGLALTAAVMTVASAGALALCVWWWRGIDEAAREAHKWAWWWGGCTGMAVGAAALMTLSFRDDGSTVDSLGVGAVDLITGGMFAILLFQLAGYGVAWAVWWLRHR